MRWLVNGELSIFESEMILLHMGERSLALLPTDPIRSDPPRRGGGVSVQHTKFDGDGLPRRG